MSDITDEVVGEKSFSKGSFRPSLVSAAWISATANEDGGDEATEKKTEDDEFEDTLSPDECDKTAADIALFFQEENDTTETPFKEFQKTVGSERLTSASKDEECTPFTALKMCVSTEKKASPAGNDFLFELDDDVPVVNHELLLGIDNEKVLSPSEIVPIAPEALTEDDIVDAIKSLMSSKTLECSTKQWMKLIADHLSIESVPSEWKTTIKNVVMAEAEVSPYPNSLFCFFV
jgi:hypothetical protein